MNRGTFLRRMLLAIPGGALLADGLATGPLASIADHDPDWIERPTVYGPTSIQSVMQQICDEWMPGSVVECSPDPEFHVLEYEQQAMPVGEALDELGRIVSYNVRWVSREGGTLHPVASPAIGP